MFKFKVWTGIATCFDVELHAETSKKAIKKLQAICGDDHVKFKFLW